MIVAFPTSTLRVLCKSFSTGCGRWECGGSREGRAEGRNLWSCAGWVPGPGSNWQCIAGGSARMPVQEVFWQARPAAGRSGRTFCAGFESACRPPGIGDKKYYPSRSDQSIRPHLSPAISAESRLSILWLFLHSIKLYHDLSLSATNCPPGAMNCRFPPWAGKVLKGLFKIFKKSLVKYRRANHRFTRIIDNHCVTTPLYLWISMYLTFLLWFFNYFNIYNIRKWRDTNSHNLHLPISGTTSSLRNFSSTCLCENPIAWEISTNVDDIRLQEARSKNCTVSLCRR